MTAICTVYWIHHEKHTNPNIEGYIGITKNLSKRIGEHKSCTRRGKTLPIHNAIRKYGWNNLKVKVILTGTLEECKQEEVRLRPAERIGWNLCSGGNIPVQQPLEKQREHWARTLKGRIPHKHTQDFKDTLTERNHKYLYTIWHKNGYRVEGVRLWEWCIENNIRQSCMQRVALGKRSHHRGFRCLRVAIVK